jgi:60 kDa SS-A/Ro ribonucleoprotein
VKLNTAVAREKKFTHEGAVAYQHTNAAQDLQRSVMACMLWEDTFYESGIEIAKRISELVPQVTAETVSLMAIEAREKMKLRHVPLLLACELAKHKTHRHVVAKTVEKIIQRADELSEILAIYQRGREGTKKLNKLSKQMQKGLALAFRKFNEYSLAKYNRDGAVKLRDVLFLCHAKPKDAEQAKLWKRLIDGELATPDTWEVALSATKGEAKKEAWERLLKEEKLGALALIRNLRNMTESKVSKSLVTEQLAKVDVSRVLPFRFVAAAVAAPEFEEQLDALLVKSSQQAEKLAGHTVLVVDVSGSMYGSGNISKRSDMTRVEAAGALAAIARERCESVSIYATAGNDYARTHATARVPTRRGMALVEKFRKQGFAGELGGGGIFLTQCLDFINRQETEAADRLIVFTDEQDCDLKLKPDEANAFGRKGNYLINISSEKNGIGYKPKWTHIDGFSEAVLDYIRAAEAQ